MKKKLAVLGIVAVLLTVAFAPNLSTDFFEDIYANGWIHASEYLEVGNDTSWARLGKAITGSRLDLASNAWYNGSRWNRDDTDFPWALFVQQDGAQAFLGGGAGSNPIEWGDMGAILQVNAVGRTVVVGTDSDDATLAVNGDADIDGSMSVDGFIVTNAGVVSYSNIVAYGDVVADGDVEAGSVIVGDDIVAGGEIVAGDYLQIKAISGIPPNIDCNSQAEWGRMTIDYGSVLWICGAEAGGTWHYFMPDGQ